MISAKRIIAIFRQRGGGDEFTSPADRLTPEQFAYLENVAGGKPIIAKVSSQNEWFILAKSLLVFKCLREMRRVHFDEIYTIAIPKADFLKPRIKSEGGNLDVGLRDGATLRVKVEPGGPYFGLMNVLMRIAKINRRQNSRVGPGDESVSPTTADQRPTTPL